MLIFLYNATNMWNKMENFELRFKDQSHGVQHSGFVTDPLIWVLVPTWTLLKLKLPLHMSKNFLKTLTHLNDMNLMKSQAN